MTINYRADIDGLRAIAVLSVVLFHAGFENFAGGFVGVDVFFVISGYLITGIILREIETDQFLILKFYERRIRRIFPALFVVIAFVMFVSFFLFSAPNFQEVGKEIAATTAFLSNVLFWTQSGYFEVPSSQNPLLHMWSLAVEEQFYIFFPLLLAFLVRRYKSFYSWILVGITLLSFFSNLYFLKLDDSSSFYLAPMRVWELLIGSLLALKFIPVIQNKKIQSLLSLAGLALIGASVFSFTNNTPFPGTAALLPTIGAALIIYSGIQETSAGNILTFPALVFIGKISYSLYLWHWPVLVFWKYYAILKLTSVEYLVALGVIFILSILSWKFVENPFRSIKSQKGKSIIKYAFGTMGLFLAAGAFIYLGQGFPTRFADYQTYAENNINNRWNICAYKEGVKIAKFTFCELGAEDKEPTFLVWGDSHASALAWGIDASASRNQAAGRLIYWRGCSPLLGIDNKKGDIQHCYKSTNEILSYIEDNPNFETIILVARWAFSSEGTRYKLESGPQKPLVDMIDLNNTGKNNTEIFRVGFQRTIEKLLELNRSVVIVSGVPEIGYEVPSAYFIARQTGRDLNDIIAPTKAEFFERNKNVFEVINAYVGVDNVYIVHPWEKLCDSNRCYVLKNEILLYDDNNHLSQSGSESISDIFDSIFGGVNLP